MKILIVVFTLVYTNDNVTQKTVVSFNFNIHFQTVATRLHKIIDLSFLSNQICFGRDSVTKVFFANGV